MDSHKRLRLAYDLLDSVIQAEATAQVTEAQRAELRRRLAEYRANPKPHAHVPGVTNPDGTPWLPIK
ncbi:MAG: addiction module protein [Alphaproteobacteria bacterium]|nr:addiction module protein [Alphaproteobacteria bacterium]